MEYKGVNDSMIKEQYKNSINLSARLNLHKFNTNKLDWNVWFFDKMKIPSQCRILELGCGNGIFWQKNSDKISEYWDIVLSDFSEGMLRSAKENIQRDDIKYEIIDIQDIPYEDNSFDIIIARHMLYHAPDLDRALSEVRRVLKPGGRFYASTNGKGHMQELTDLIRSYIKDMDYDPFKAIIKFQLENGSEILRRYFQAVEVEDFAGQIVVQQAEPVVSYIASIFDAETLLSDEQKVEQLHQFVQKEIDRTGELKITTWAGMLQGSKL